MVIVISVLRYEIRASLTSAWDKYGLTWVQSTHIGLADSNVRWCSLTDQHDNYTLISNALAEVKHDIFLYEWDQP